MAQKVPSKIDLIGLLRVMQSDVNSHKTGRIVGYNIVYVIFLIIYNSIINQTKNKNFKLFNKQKKEELTFFNINSYFFVLCLYEFKLDLTRTLFVCISRRYIQMVHLDAISRCSNWVLFVVFISSIHPDESSECNYVRLLFIFFNLHMHLGGLVN